MQHRWPNVYTDGKLKGTGIDTIAIVTAENNLAYNAGITAWAFDFYLPAEITHAEDPDEKHEWLQCGLEAFLQTANNSLMKFWVTVITDNQYGLSYPSTNEWKYLDAFADYVAALMQHPQYLRVRGRPVIGLFGLSPTGHGPDMDLTRWQQFLTPLGGQAGVYAIEMDGNVSKGQELSMNALYPYGVQSLPASQGHKPWTLLADVERAAFGGAVPGFDPISRLTPCADSRGLATSVDARTFEDQPTMPQWYEHVRDGMRVAGARMGMTFWNELAEEGPACVPTLQEGTRYLDGIRWAARFRRDDTYTYPINAYNADPAIVENSGTWTYVGPLPTGVAGCHDRDQVISANTGDYKKLIHVRLLEVDVYAETGPDCGIAEIYKNDVLDQTIDCYATSQTTSAKIATVTFSGADGTVKVLVKGTKHASSSSVQIKLDYFDLTYVP